MEEDIPAEATTSAEASDARETVVTCMISNFISKTTLNSFNPQPETKTPTPHNS